MKRNLKTGLLAVAAGGMVAANSASAAVDVTDIVTAIDGVIAPVSLIGAAVLLVVVTIKTFKWVRQAF